MFLHMDFPNMLNIKSRLAKLNCNENLKQNIIGVFIELLLFNQPYRLMQQPDPDSILQQCLANHYTLHLKQVNMFDQSSLACNINAIYKAFKFSSEICKLDRHIHRKQHGIVHSTAGIGLICVLLYLAKIWLVY